jgi:hypothetical protein
MAELSHEAWRTRWLPELDPGVAPYVDALRTEGIEKPLSPAMAATATLRPISQTEALPRHAR